MARYKKGQSGNPAGRPKGKAPKLVEIRGRITEAMPDIIDSLITQAKAGDAAAAKLLLERVCPALKPQAVPVAITHDGTLLDQANNVINATLEGKIPPDIGAQLVNALAAQGRLIELQDIQQRLERLENGNN